MELHTSFVVPSPGGMDARGQSSDPDWMQASLYHFCVQFNQIGLQQTAATQPN